MKKLWLRLAFDESGGGGISWHIKHFYLDGQDILETGLKRAFTAINGHGCERLLTKILNQGMKLVP